jgi:hypothetical protein
MSNQRAPSGDWGIVVPFFLALMFAIWPYAVWHGCESGGSGLSGCGAESEWVWNAQAWVACGIWWGVLILLPALIWLGNRPAKARRSGRPPRGPLPIEVLRPPPPSAARPICLHLNAVKVNSSVPGLDMTYRCWCPACETALPANFRYPCCGGEPGTLPGDRHAYNCPHRTVRS